MFHWAVRSACRSSGAWCCSLVIYKHAAPTTLEPSPLTLNRWVSEGASPRLRVPHTFFTNVVGLAVEFPLKEVGHQTPPTLTEEIFQYARHQ